MHLYALAALERDLPWCMAHELLPPRAGRALPEQLRSLCSSLAPQSQQLVDSFGVPDHLVAAPIAGDWEGYNAVDNQGELVGRQFV